MQKIKILCVSSCLLALAACTPSTTGLKDDKLIRPEYLRTERMIHMTFPEIQSSLFKHDRLCGKAPVFTMTEGQASYATVTEANTDEIPWNQTIVFDLMWLQESKLNETRTKVLVYSFFSNADIKRRINNIFSAIEKPENCLSD